LATQIGKRPSHKERGTTIWMTTTKKICCKKKREYSRKMRSQSAGKQPDQPRSIEQTDIEFDSALFEPTNNESDEGVSYFYVFSKL
jgi:hypothetical protein